MEYNEWRKLREKFMDHLAKTPNANWLPFDRQIDEVVIANGPTGSVMNVFFVKQPTENPLGISYREFLEANNIKEADFLN